MPETIADLGTVPVSNASFGERHRITVLDSVRGLAALIVVCHHSLLSQPAFSDFFFSGWRTQPTGVAQDLLFHSPLRIIWAGYEAVILFYVLSGFVLALPWLAQRPPTYVQFGLKRICRIYLPYLAAMAFATVLDVLCSFRAPIAGLSDWVNQMNWSNPVTGSMLVNHVLMTGLQNNINGPIHSLVWETRVSLIFPLLIAPVILWRLRGLAAVSAALLAFVGAVLWKYGAYDSAWSLLASKSGLDKIGKAVLEFEWTAFFAVIFLMGAAVALTMERFARSTPRWVAGIGVVVGLLMIQAHWSRLELVQDLFVAIGSCALIAAVLPQSRVHQLLMHPTLVWFGRISYSLYLVHVPILLAGLILLRGVVPLWVVLVGAPMVSIAAAALFQVGIVEPSARLGRVLSGRFAARRVRSVKLA